MIAWSDLAARQCHRRSTLPDESERLRFLKTITDGVDVRRFLGFQRREPGQLQTAAVTLADLAVLVESARRSGERLDDKRFKARKKQLIERQAQDLLEFIEPKYGLERVVGHDAAKKRLLDDAEIIRRGRIGRGADGLSVQRAGGHRQDFSGRPAWPVRSAFRASR